jgi:acetyl esterase/lipase
VAYASGSPTQKLDIYLPNEGKGPFPVIVAIHGGGFEGGDKNTGEVNAEMDGLARGYAVVSVNYRLAKEAVFPAAVQDVKAAIRFLRANAKKYNLDPSRVVAWGDSAGANIAAMIGTTAGVKELEDLSMGNANQPSDVKVVVDFFGPTDFADMDAAYARAGVTQHMQHSGADSSESHYVGFQVTADPDRARKADPETYVSAKTPPFFIENGDKDPVVPPSSHVAFAAKLEAAIGKDKVVHIVLEGSGHGGPAFQTKENLDKVFAFIDKYLK